MQNGKLLIRPAAVLNIPLRDAQALLNAGNGDAALLYLHILQNNGILDAARAATELHRSDHDIELAAGRLRQMGILSEGEAREPVQTPVPEPARELPEYRAQDVARRSMESPGFQELVTEVQKILGRILSTTDVKKLFGIYDELALPPEVIMTLVQYCVDQSREKYGRQRTVGFAAIEKEAYIWVNREIVTLEQADHWIREQDRRRDILSQLKRELGIRDRELSKTEREYLLSWIDLGFSPEAIAIAADRTITKTHKLSWNYMDSIIRSWHGMNLHTPEEIEAKDPPNARKAKKTAGTANAAEPQDSAKTLEQLARIREKMKNT